MLFHIIGVKEDDKPINNSLYNDEQHTVKYDIDILIESIDINEARRVSKLWWIILISIKEYPLKDENSFGNIYLKANCDWLNIRVVIHMDDLHEAAILFFNIWLEINEINYLNNPESENESKKILKDAKIYADEQKNRIRAVSYTHLTLPTIYSV